MKGIHCRRGVALRTILGIVLGGVIAALFVVMLLPWRSDPEGRPTTALIVARRVDPAIDRCAACHLRSTPGIVNQWSKSVHGLRGITCRSCHEVDESNPYAEEHIGTFVSTVVTPRVCAQCHPRAVEEFMRSRHSLPAWASLNGTEDFEHDSELMAIWNGMEHLPEREDIALSRRTALFEQEGPEVTGLTCVRCHEIGRPNLDGSVGQCATCHIRHTFSLEQARRPETCNICHTGADQPQWDIYTESVHGVIYQTQTEEFNFSQSAGRIGVDDFPAATCQLCHMSGFGSQATTHDVGERLSWYLHQPIAQHRPDHDRRRLAMTEICRQCHSTEFIRREFDAADAVVDWTNVRVEEANDIIVGLIAAGLIPPEDFSHPLHHEGFDLWHYYGRSARFGAFMQGPDHTQWHGIYPLLRTLSDMHNQASLMLEQSAGEVNPNE